MTHWTCCKCDEKNKGDREKCNNCGLLKEDVDDSLPAKLDKLHPVLLKIRSAIALHDRIAAQRAILEADGAGVEIEPHVRLLLLRWLTEAGLPTPPARPVRDGQQGSVPAEAETSQRAAAPNAAAAVTSDAKVPERKGPHDALLRIRRCIARRDREGVRRAIAAADARSVPIKASVRWMLSLWLVGAAPEERIVAKPEEKPEPAEATPVKTDVTEAAAAGAHPESAACHDASASQTSAAGAATEGIWAVSQEEAMASSVPRGLEPTRRVLLAAATAKDGSRAPRPFLGGVMPKAMARRREEHFPSQDASAGHGTWQEWGQSSGSNYGSEYASGYSRTGSHHPVMQPPSIPPPNYAPHYNAEQESSGNNLGSLAAYIKSKRIHEYKQSQTLRNNVHAQVLAGAQYTQRRRANAFGSAASSEQQDQDHDAEPTYTPPSTFAAMFAAQHDEKALAELPSLFPAAARAPPAMSPPSMSPPSMSPPAMSPPSMAPPAMSPPAMSAPAMPPPPHQPWDGRSGIVFSKPVMKGSDDAMAELNRLVGGTPAEAASATAAAAPVSTESALEFFDVAIEAAAAAAPPAFPPLPPLPGFPPSMPSMPGFPPLRKMTTPNDTPPKMPSMPGFPPLPPADAPPLPQEEPAAPKRSRAAEKLERMLQEDQKEEKHAATSSRSGQEPPGGDAKEGKRPKASKVGDQGDSGHLAKDSKGAEDRRQTDARDVCGDFRRGKCKYGDSCKYSHDTVGRADEDRPKERTQERNRRSRSRRSRRRPSRGRSRSRRRNVEAPKVPRRRDEPKIPQLPQKPIAAAEEAPKGKKADKKREGKKYAEWDHDTKAEQKKEKEVDASEKEAWEYVKQDAFGSGNFFDFNAF